MAPELVRACRLILVGVGPNEKLVGITPMEAYQWFLLGMMAAWTPSLLALALRPRQNSADNNKSALR
jgi:hypothetical protein